MPEETSEITSSNPYIIQQVENLNSTIPNEPPPSYHEAIRSPRLPPPKPPHVSTPSCNQNSIPLTRHFCDLFCPTCQQTVHSRVETSSTILTFLLATLLLFFCFFLVFLPFCISSCKRTKHYCPTCHQQLGEIREFE